MQISYDIQNIVRILYNSKQKITRIVVILVEELHIIIRTMLYFEYIHICSKYVRESNFSFIILRFVHFCILVVVPMPKYWRI